MLHTRSWRRFGAALLSMSLLTPLATARAHEALTSAIDAAHLAEHADFVFKGTVTNIAYRDSAPNPKLDARGNPLLDGTGAPLLQDGSKLAHTFVTFAIDKVYKGHADAAEVTLRFRGGVQEELEPELDDTGAPILSEVVYLAGEAPLFDIGDRDILFVERNTDKPCPLVGGNDGRFRLLNRDVASFSDEQVYTDLGQEVSRIDAVAPGDPPSARLGAPHDLVEVNSTQMGTGVLEVVKGPDPVVLDTDGDVPPDPDPAPLPQFSEAEFDSYLEAVVVDDPSLPAVVSADITVPFFGRPSIDVRPQPVERASRRPEPRPWLKELPMRERRAVRVAEREEKRAFRDHDGNPVLP